MTTIIGLLGGAGAGKTATADYLALHYGAVRYSLAAPLKEIAKRVMHFSDAQVYGSQNDKEAVDERYGMSPRTFLQRLGTEGLRAVFGADVWVDLLLKQIGQDAPLLAVVSDVRFANEADAIKYAPSRSDAGATGYVWRLENPERITNADTTHPSESEWMSASYDYAIAPLHRGLPALHALIDDACKHYRIFRVRREMAL